MERPYEGQTHGHPQAPYPTPAQGAPAAQGTPPISSLPAEAPPTRSKLLRGFIVTILILIMGAVSMAALIRSRRKPKRKRPGALSLRVKTVLAKHGNRMLYLEGYGTSQSDKRIEIVPEVSGKVVWTTKEFKPGTRVKKNSLLFTIDSRTFRLTKARLQAQLASLKQQIKTTRRLLKLSNRSFMRNRRLYRKRALARSNLESTEMVLLERTQRLETLLQNQRSAEIQLKTASLNLSRTRIFAPFHGRISSGGVDRGAFVAQGRPVAVLESTEAIDIPIAFPLEELYKIVDEEGKPIKHSLIPTHLAKLPPVLISHPQHQNMRWKGRVIRVGARLNLQTRTINLWVRVKQVNTHSITLLPGLFCKVRIPARRISDVITIPTQALYGSRVYLIKTKLLKAGDTLKRNIPSHRLKAGDTLKKDLSLHSLWSRKVRVLHKDSEQVIIASGLKDGERIVTTQLTDPVEGTPVFLSTP